MLNLLLCPYSTAVSVHTGNDDMPQEMKHTWPDTHTCIIQYYTTPVQYSLHQHTTLPPLSSHLAFLMRVSFHILVDQLIDSGKTCSEYQSVPQLGQSLDNSPLKVPELFLHWCLNVWTWPSFDKPFCWGYVTGLYVTGFTATAILTATSYIVYRFWISGISYW